MVLIRQKRDIELVERFKGGDKKAFDELYETYKKVIVNYLYRMTKNRTMAEELAQESMVKVYMSIDKYSPTGSFSSWVYAIARNLAKNEFRRLGVRKSVSLDMNIRSDTNMTLADILSGGDADASEALGAKEIQEMIQEVLMVMPAEFREVITLCVIQEISYEEAAKIIGCTKSTVAIRLFRGRKIFADIVEKYNQNGER